MAAAALLCACACVPRDPGQDGADPGAGGSYVESGEERLVPADARLEITHDFPDARLRLTAGSTDAERLSLDAAMPRSVDPGLQYRLQLGDFVREVGDGTLYVDGRTKAKGVAWLTLANGRLFGDIARTDGGKSYRVRADLSVLCVPSGGQVDTDLTSEFCRPYAALLR